MLKRLWRTLAVAAVALSLAVPFAAPVAANQGGCHTEFQYHDYATAETSSPSWPLSRSGASATINVANNEFDICIGEDGNGPSVWVAIVPRDISDDNAIIQIGVIECRSVLYPGVCSGENSPHFFYAYGGCLYPPYSIPTPHDLGPANTGNHSIALYLMPDNNWHFNIDGDEVYQIPNTFIGCWSGPSRRKAAYSAERWDRGDSTGTLITGDYSYLIDTRYGVYGQGWFPNGWGSGPCPFQGTYNHCSMYSNGDPYSDSVKFWSVAS